MSFEGDKKREHAAMADQAMQEGDLRKGGFHLAIRAGVPIVPVALRGTRELMPAGSLLLRSGTMTVIIGEPIATQGLSDEERATLSDRVRSAVESMLRG